MKVFVYWNLHRNCWSVRCQDSRYPEQYGKVVGHYSSFEIENATFKVSERGRQRVLAEKRKNVHAGVMGDFVKGMHTANHGRMADPVKQLAEFKKVTYNPYKGSTFVETENFTPVTSAAKVQGFWNRSVIFA